MRHYHIASVTYIQTQRWFINACSCHVTEIFLARDVMTVN